MQLTSAIYSLLQLSFHARCTKSVRVVIPTEDATLVWKISWLELPGVGLNPQFMTKDARF